MKKDVIHLHTHVNNLPTPRATTLGECKKRSLRDFTAFHLPLKKSNNAAHHSTQTQPLLSATLYKKKQHKVIEETKTFKILIRQSRMFFLK
mmetsp:Transcript_42386/g.62331  ORF Transcript_42386/g.62331 Transcript_42386/m.62331 type:complete len:91 (-) Transcript_42386:570-842(-)